MNGFSESHFQEGGRSEASLGFGPRSTGQHFGGPVQHTHLSEPFPQQKVGSKKLNWS